MFNFIVQIPFYHYNGIRVCYSIIAIEEAHFDEVVHSAFAF